MTQAPGRRRHFCSMVFHSTVSFHYSMTWDGLEKRCWIQCFASIKQWFHLFSHRIFISAHLCRVLPTWKVRSVSSSSVLSYIQILRTCQGSDLTTRLVKLCRHRVCGNPALVTSFSQAFDAWTQDPLLLRVDWSWCLSCIGAESILQDPISSTS